MDIDITITSVAFQTINFDTGLGIGILETNFIQILVFDKCLIEEGTRYPVGSFFPTSTVQGIEVDASGMVNNPGAGNAISFNFVEGINENALIYTSSGSDATTATVQFCLQVGLYKDTYLTNWQEMKLTYSIDLTTSIATITGALGSGALDFFDMLGIDTALDGAIESFFCDKDTQQELPEGIATRQGSTTSICFNVVDDAQFEVEDVLELLIRDLGASAQVQELYTDMGTKVGGTYSEKYCVQTTPTRRTCIVSFLLGASFYDFNTMQLTGDGALLVEFGGADGRKQRMLRTLSSFGSSASSSRRMQQQSLSGDETIAKVTIKPQNFLVDHSLDQSSAAATVTTVTSAVVIDAMWWALFLTCSSWWI